MLRSGSAGGGLTSGRAHGHDGRDGSEQQHHADDRPHDVGAGGAVVDERLVRPVVGVGDGQPGPLRDRGPAGPEEERGEVVALVRLGQHLLLHGVGLAQRGERRVAAEERAVVRGGGPHRRQAIGADGERAARCVVAVLAQLAGQAGFERRARFGGQGVEALAVCSFGPDLEQPDRFAMQPVCGPVRGLIRAVAPDRAELLAAGGLPHELPAQDVVARIHELARLAHDPLGDRRRLAIDLSAHEAEQRERGDQGRRQYPPQAASARGSRLMILRHVEADSCRCLEQASCRANNYLILLCIYVCAL